MNPLWITLCVGPGSSNRNYQLMTHFVQPVRTGTRRECNYDWYSTEFTYNYYKKLCDVPRSLIDLIREASVSYGVPFNNLYQQFTIGEIALEISEQGVTVYKPYDKSKIKAQAQTSEPELHLCDEMPVINDTIPTADVFTADVTSLI